MIMVQDSIYQHYVKTYQDEIITRQFFDETRNMKYNQVLLPKHLVPELIESLHGKAKGY